jgi:hypothetical protein
MRVITFAHAFFRGAAPDHDRLFAATRCSVSEGRLACSIVVSRHVRVASFDARLAATLSSSHAIRSENCLRFALRSSPLRMNVRHVTAEKVWLGWFKGNAISDSPTLFLGPRKASSPHSPDCLLDAPFCVPDSLPQLVVGLEGYREAIATGQVGSNRIEVI